MEITLRILVTGAEGFLGKNLIAELNNKGYDKITFFTEGILWKTSMKIQRVVTSSSI